MTNATPGRRRGAPLLSLAAASLATALATAPHAAAQQPEDMDREDRLLAYAQCMRDNGYAEFPDPGPDGLQFLIDRSDPSAAPRFQSAQEACRDLSPMGQASGSPDPERMEQLVAFAECMRDNGVSEFPDPAADGRFDLRGASIEPESPTTQAAMQTCRSTAGPGGVLIGG